MVRPLFPSKLRIVLAKSFCSDESRPKVALNTKLFHKGVLGRIIETRNPKTKVIPIVCKSSCMGKRNTSTLQVKSGVGQTSTIAQKIAPIIMVNPMMPGIIKPGTKKISTSTRQTPNKKMINSSWPARPATYFDPKNTKSKVMPATPKIPKPGVLNSTKIQTKPMLSKIGAIPFSHKPISSAQFTSISTRS